MLSCLGHWMLNALWSFEFLIHRILEIKIKIKITQGDFAEDESGSLSRESVDGSNVCCSRVDC